MASGAAGVATASVSHPIVSALDEKDLPDAARILRLALWHLPGRAYFAPRSRMSPCTGTMTPVIAAPAPTSSMIGDNLG
jgi:hypothetical protein